MVKKKGGKIIQLLTPENYIRKKSRDLPIVECTVNSGWEKSGMATVTVARGHSNGNITYCLYLVDLLCLGVKNTLFSFNTPLFEYSEFKDKQSENLDLIPIDYTLAHNIIFAGVAYAEDYGFKPHKDFSLTTQYHLAEDNDDVEFMDIECGMDGKPTYFRGPDEDDKKINQILAQLERTAGPGNYHFVIGDGDDWSDNDDDDDKEREEEDDDWKEEDEYDDQFFEENRAEFISLLQKEGNYREKESIRLCELTEFFFDSLIDEEMVGKYFGEFSSAMSSIDIADHGIPDEILGVEPGDPRATEELKDLFIRIFESRSYGKKKIQKQLDAFRKIAGDIPAVYFAELELETEKESDGYEEKLRQYALRFPNYSLLKIIYFTAQFHDNGKDTVILVPGHALDVEFFFPGRKSIHKMELLYFLTFAVLDATKRKNPSEIEALWEFFHELDIPEKEKVIPMLMLTKIGYVVEYLKADDDTLPDAGIQTIHWDE
ncbi:MAG: hypothetical protein AB2L20_27605 [Mangrovibacterium sp.]